MARATWIVEGPNGPHTVKATYGYWFGWLRIRVDGTEVRSQRALDAMCWDQGVDVAFAVGSQRAVVSIRPNRLFPTTRYVFSLRADGRTIAGAAHGRPQVVPPLAPPGLSDRWPGTRSRPTGVGENQPTFVPTQPHRPTMSRALVWLGIGSLVWFFAFGIVTDYGLEAIGILRGQRSALVKVLHLGLAVTPAVLWAVSPVISPYRPFRWMRASPQPQLTLMPDGIAVTLPDRGNGWFSWDEIGYLVNRPTWWGQSKADLLAPDGSRLARLPGTFTKFEHGSWVYLADAVVEARPDRFVMAGPSWGRPAFGLRPARAREPAPRLHPS